MSRVVAIAIDAILVGFIYAVVAAVLTGLGDWGAFLISGLIYVAVSVGYFVYTWTRRRATIGQQLLGIQTVNAADSAALTQDQALRRWVFLAGPGSVAQMFAFGAGIVLGVVGWVVALLALTYEIYLLFSASQSATRQGFHDVQAGSIVIKRPS